MRDPVTKDHLKPVLECMLEAQALREESWDPATQTYLKDSVGCHVEACGGDETVGYLLHLFSHWNNDVETVAQDHFGIRPRPLALATNI